MEYMEKAAACDIELGAEFIYMAATLIHIKSKLLLPKDPELEKIAPEEDPRTELVEHLLEHERFKNAAEMLQQKRLIEEAAWSNPPTQQFLTEDEQPGLAVTLFDLVKTFQQVLDRAKSRPLYEVGREEVSVPDMIRVLRRLLEETPANQTVSAVQLFEQQRSKRAMLCLFLAILELVKRQAVLLQQPDAFGDIAIKRTKGFAEAFENDDAVSAVDQEYN